MIRPALLYVPVGPARPNTGVWITGWYNVPSGKSFAQRVTIQFSGTPIVIYAQVPDSNLEWSGSTLIYVTRPESFVIKNARSRNARLADGSGQLEVVNGEGIMMQKDFTYDLR